MELNYFKDILFDLINESDEPDAVQIDSDELRNTFTVRAFPQKNRYCISDESALSTVQTAQAIITK